MYYYLYTIVINIDLILRVLTRQVITTFKHCEFITLSSFFIFQVTN